MTLHQKRGLVAQEAFKWTSDGVPPTWRLQKLVDNTNANKSCLVGGWTNPSEKYAQVKLDHFPSFRDENKKYLKPPASCLLLLQTRRRDPKRVYLDGIFWRSDRGFLDVPPKESQVFTFQSFHQDSSTAIGEFVKKELVHFDVCELLLLGNHLIESTPFTNLAGGKSCRSLMRCRMTLREQFWCQGWGIMISAQIIATSHDLTPRGSWGSSSGLPFKRIRRYIGVK